MKGLLISIINYSSERYAATFFEDSLLAIAQEVLLNSLFISAKLITFVLFDFTYLIIASVLKSISFHLCFLSSDFFKLIVPTISPTSGFEFHVISLSFQAFELTV